MATFWMWSLTTLHVFVSIFFLFHSIPFQLKFRIIVNFSHFIAGAGKQGLTCVAQATVKVNYLGQSTTIFLRNDSVASMTVNGDDKTDDLPFYLSGDYIYARREDEKVVTLNFNDGLIIKWNPVSFVDNRLIITAPYTYMHKIGGMCGTYDGDKSNDLLTAEGVTVKNTTAFGNSWRVKETCDESTNIGDIPHPCDLFPDRLDRAKQSCSYLINGPFDGCKVSPANTHSDCLYDACASDTEDKFNAVVNAAYVSLAEECCEAGTPVDWRATVPGAGKFWIKYSMLFDIDLNY